MTEQKIRRKLKSVVLPKKLKSVQALLSEINSSMMYITSYIEAIKEKEEANLRIISTRNEGMGMIYRHVLKPALVSALLNLERMGALPSGTTANFFPDTDTVAIKKSATIRKSTKKVVDIKTKQKDKKK